MKATEASFLQFLRTSPQFVIPIYQRTYSWTERECQKLWDDIMRAGRNDEVSAHFVGSVVYIEKGLSQVSSQAPLLVIDGQQRLTSVTLLLEALARHLGDEEPVDGFSAKKIRNYFLLNPLEDGERHFKLVLTQTDKDSLTAIVRQKALSAERSVRIAQNFELFDGLVVSLGDDLEILCKGLSKLVIVDVALNRDQDNPQLIFESMNSTGRELSQADLIRNFILMGLEPNQQTRLYEDHWHPMELQFGQEAYGSHFDKFMRHYLTLKTGDIPNVRAVYEAFRAYARQPEVDAAGVDELVRDVHDFASHYCAMALGREPDRALAEAFCDLGELKVDVAYPFLLELYHDYSSGALSRGDLLQAVRLTEAYVFRRAICAIPTNTLNRTFASLGRSLRKDRYLESIEAAYLILSSYRRFPSDDEFMRDFAVRDLYSFRSRSYWLRRLENDGRKERVPVRDYTIEHIMPQNRELSREWREDLGPDWERVHETKLHTLGNLTLTGYNSEYSDRPFARKRDMEGGFKESPLRLNEGLGSTERWDEAAIDARALRLARQAVRVWATPRLDSDALASYQQAKAQNVDVSVGIADQVRTVKGSVPRQEFEPELYKRIRQVVSEGDILRTLSTGSENVVGVFDRSGIEVKTPEAARERKTRRVPANLFNAAWDELHRSGQVSRRALTELLGTTAAKRSSAVLSVLARFSEVSVVETHPILLRLDQGADG